MSLTPEQSQQLSMDAVDVYNAMEDEILLNVAKHLSKHNGQLTPESIHTWQMSQLAQLGGLTQSNVITIAKHSGMSIDAVSMALQQAQSHVVKPTQTTLQKAVQLGLLLQPTSPVGQTLDAIFSKYLAQAKSVFNLVNTTMLDGARQIYLDVINQTVGKVIAGSRTPKQTMRETLQRWAKKGLPAIVDKAYKRWSPEAYISLVTRSTVNNVANDSQFALMDHYGNDLVEVSAHVGARPLCAPFQGKIYSRSGMSTKYPAWSSTSYGDPAGLLGCNCRHVTYVYVEGLSTPRATPVDPFENDKQYQLSQVQRKNERDIRKAKRELAMMEALQDAEGIEQARAKVREKQATMREFIKNTGRRRNYSREAPAEQILGKLSR